MTQTGIILASGEASRFGGLLKELLPIGDNKTVIDSSIEKLRNCFQIIIVTSPEKIDTHVRHFKQPRYQGLPIIYAIRKEPEMFGAIRAALPFVSEVNTVLMADTIFSGPVEMPHTDLSFGTFLTFNPSQLSVFDKGKILTKPNPAPYANMPAWGTFSFSSAVAEYWRGLENIHYDTALNLAIDKYGATGYPIARYYDLGTFERYREYICQL